MTVFVVQHKVRDSGAWKPVFDEHEPVRRSHGAQRHWLYRTTEDPNDVVVAIEFSSHEQGRAFLEDPSLREAMERAGVQGEPHIHFREPVESVELLIADRRARQVNGQRHGLASHPPAPGLKRDRRVAASGGEWAPDRDKLREHPARGRYAAVRGGETP